MQITFTLTGRRAHIIATIWARLAQDFPERYADPSDMLQALVEALIDEHIGEHIHDLSGSADLPH